MGLLVTVTLVKVSFGLAAYGGEGGGNGGLCDLQYRLFGLNGTCLDFKLGVGFE